MLANANLYPFHFPIEFWRRKKKKQRPISNAAFFSPAGVCYAENFAVKSLAYIFLAGLRWCARLVKCEVGRKQTETQNGAREKMRQCVRRKKKIFVADWVLIKNKNKVQKMSIKYERQMQRENDIACGHMQCVRVFRFYVLLFVPIFFLCAISIFWQMKMDAAEQIRKSLLIWKATQNRNKRIASC